MPSKTFTLLDGAVELRVKWSKHEINMPWFRIAGRKFECMSDLEDHMAREAARAVREIKSANDKE